MEYVDGTIERCRQQGLVPLRVLDIEESKRRGSFARVVDEDGETSAVWFWWYQAKVGEIVVCRIPDRIDGRMEVGDERARGVVDRVPRDIVEVYRRATRTAGDPPL